MKTPKPRPVILIDSSEGLPYAFPDQLCQKENLYTGDYSVAGCEHELSIERKTLDDFCGSLTAGRERFLDGEDSVCARLRSLPYRAIVVEATFEDVIRGAYRSKVTPQSMAGTVTKIMLDFQIPILFGGDRAWCERWVERALVRHWEKAKEVSK